MFFSHNKVQFISKRGFNELLVIFDSKVMKSNGRMKKIDHGCLMFKEASVDLDGFAVLRTSNSAKSRNAAMTIVMKSSK